MACLFPEMFSIALRMLIKFAWQKIQHEGDNDRELY